MVEKVNILIPKIFLEILKRSEDISVCLAECIFYFFLVSVSRIMKTITVKYNSYKQRTTTFSENRLYVTLQTHR